MFRADILEEKGRNVFIHNLLDLGKSLSAPEEILDAARKLTPAYTITRYVDAANGVPADLFNEEDAKTYLSSGENVILFGSRARGDHLEESDVDLLFISEAFSRHPPPFLK